MARLTDEIIEEIHAVRLQHAARFDYDLDRIIDDLRAGQEKHVAEGWQLIKAPETLPVLPNSALLRTRFAHH
jgi:hypothetical protein